MTNRMAKEALQFCIKRDGDKCKMCKKPSKYLVLDHIDNNRKYNPLDGSNWQALCRSCNTKKNPRGHSKRGLHARDRMKHYMSVCVCEYDNDHISQREKAFQNYDVVTTSEQLMINKESERLFRKWLLEVLVQVGLIEFREAVNSGAEHAHCSQVTINRYLDKLCSYEGKFEYILDKNNRKFIRLKEEFRAVYNGVKPRKANTEEEHGDDQTSNL